jgi:DNA-binding transcriptional LysR family regulator
MDSDRRRHALDFLQLKYFQAVARHEHMTRAAQELNVSQPSLSNTISRLEKKLGVPLFVRQGRQIRLTAFGKTYLERVDRIFLELQEGEREIKEMASLDQGVISIAVTMPNLLPYLLKGFLSRYPHVRIFQTQAYSAQEILSQLENAKVDVCISTTPIVGPDIEWVPLFEEEIFLSVPSGHRLAGRGSIVLREAADEPFINITSEYGFRTLTDEYCRQAGFEPNIAFEIAEASIIQHLVELDLGVTFTPALLSKFVSLASVQLHIEEPVCKRTIGLAWHKRHFRSQAAEQFLEFSKEFLLRNR